MHSNKRFAWGWVAAGVFAVSGLVAACDPEETPTPTPDAGQQNPDSGTRPDSGTPDSGAPDAGNPPDAGNDEDAGTEPDAGTEEDAGTTLTLPLAVDGSWIPSGYMGDGSSGGVTYSGTDCAARAGTGLGACHRFTWTPGGEGWAGVFWQYPEGNWGDRDGFAVPAGATSVSFYAWGTEGGEVVSFMAGMNAADGFEVPLRDVALTTTPTQYTIDLSSIQYGLVVGGFGWSAGGRTTPLVFFIDDIHWR